MAIKKIVRGIQGPASAANVTDVDYLGFDTAAAHSVSEGEVAWNADEGTVDIGLPGGVVLQSGQEFYFYVRNNSGAEIPDGTAVMATGTIGASGRITVGKMDGSDITNARLLLGVTTQAIANGADGFVTSFGKVRGVDTSAWGEGDILWIDDTTPGSLTNVEPTDGNIGMSTAIVINSSATVGTIFVRVTPRDEHNFTGRLYNYEERDASVSFTVGAASVNYTTCDNILKATLTENSVITFTNIPSYRKPITIAVTQTGGPHTLGIAYGAKTLSVTLSGAAGESLETVELWTDGTDIFVPSNGGVVWSKGV